MTFSPFKVRKCVIMSFCVDFILCQVLLSFFTHGSSPKILLLLGTEKNMKKNSSPSLSTKKVTPKKEEKGNLDLGLPLKSQTLESLIKGQKK